MNILKRWNQDLQIVMNVRKHSTLLPDFNCIIDQSIRKLNIHVIFVIIRGHMCNTLSNFIEQNQHFTKHYLIMNLIFNSILRLIWEFDHQRSAQCLVEIVQIQYHQMSVQPRLTSQLRMEGRSKIIIVSWQFKSEL